MRAFIRFFIATVVVFCCTERANSQVQVNVVLRDPVPMQLSEWRRDPTVVQVIMVNTSPTRQSFILGLEVNNLRTGQTARTRNEDARMPVFTLNPSETRTVNGTQIIDQNTITAPDELRASLISSGALPEGNYTFCVTAISSVDRTTQLGTTGQSCARFNINWIDPPQLITPVDDFTLNHTRANNFMFRPAAPIPFGTSVQYRITIVGVPDGVEPRAALSSLSPTDVIYNEVQPATTYTLPPNNTQIVDLLNRAAPRYTRFAWQVQALDIARQPLFTRGGTNGKSEIGLFGFNSRSAGTGGNVEDCTSPMTMRNYYPVNGDTVPWWQPHMIVQWSPFCNTMRSMDYELTVSDDGGRTYSNARRLSWGGDVLNAQGLTGLDRAQERAQLIITNWRNESNVAPAWMDMNTRGWLNPSAQHTWQVNATFVRPLQSGGTETVRISSSPTTFAMGLKQPINPLPANGANVPAGAVPLRFTVPPPNTTMFDPPDLLTRRRSEDRMDFGPSWEYIRVRVYQSRSDWEAERVYRTAQVRIPESGNFATGEDVSQLFAQRTFDVGSFTNGTYYWQVEYLLPNEPTAGAYRVGPLWSFTVGEGSPVTAEECVQISPRTPTQRGTWTDGTRPRFSILIKPQITRSSIRGGRLQIWQMNSPTEDSAAVMGRVPAFNETFSGNEERSIRFVRDRDGAQEYALAFVNDASGSRTFEATQGRHYLWKFTLEFDGATIRTDGTRCSRSSVVSNAGFFNLEAPSDCADNCSAPAPTNTTPATRAFSVGDVVTVGHFRLTLTRATGTGSGLTGEGTVNIPLFRGGIRVRFSGIQVNNENQMYGGTLTGMQAEDSPLPDELANRLTGDLGMTDDQVQRLDTYTSDARRLVSNFVEGSAVSLPIGFDRVVDGERITVGIIGMTFTPTQAKLNAAIAFPLPWLGPGVGLGLGARNICFSPSNIGGDGYIELYLARDFGYRAGDRSWSILLKAPTARDSGSYVSVDCHGFKELRLRAEVEFPRTWMKPVPETGQPVKAFFVTSIRTNGNWMAELGMDRFAPADAPDFVFQAERLVLDQSDVSNASGMVFPRGYRGVTTDAWRGFYMSRLYMQLPQSLTTFDSSRPPTLEVNNMLIDNSGLSFNFLAYNIIRYPRGNFGSWGASLDSIGVSLVSSSFESGFLSGQIKIPICDSGLYYRATLSRPVGVDGLQFAFIVIPRDTISASLWAARLSLLPTSRIELRAGAGTDFYAGATLNGEIGIDGNVGSLPGLRLGGMRFTNLGISTVRPYINLGTWDRASPQHGIAMSDPEPEPYAPEPTGEGGGSSGRNVGGFPISISDIGLATGDRAEGFGVGIRFTISLNLQPGSNAISGGTTLSIWGAITTGSGEPMGARFSGVDLEEIFLDADLGALTINGRVRFYNRDPIFGDGFRGAIRANLLKQVMVDVTAQFGSVQDYRYWYVDARAIIASGIPIFSGIGIYGLGGGAWYNMRRDTATQRPVNGASLAAGQTTTTSNSSTPGETNSGVRYIPVRPTSGDNFGFKATVVLGTHPSSQAFNADIYLEVQFINGGIGTITLGGNGYMMASVTDRASAKITCDARLTYDFPRKTFDGTFGINVNYAPIITGGGRMNIYVSPEYWYIKIGEPMPIENRINLNLANFLRINAYIMCGERLPGPPPIPDEVQRILGPIPPLRPAGVETSDGFAFGAQVDFNTGRLAFLIFYARLRLMFGFDLALMNLGPRARCEGIEGAPGINGWYATGQLYTLVQGSIGLFVDLWFVSGEFEILGINAAAALQGGFPNPAWMYGVVGGNYSILGGLIRGNCRFDVKVGERCSPARESGLARVDLISEMQPANGATDVPCDVEPQAISNFPVNTPFEIRDTDAEGRARVRTFKVLTRSFTLRQGGSTIPSTYRVHTDTVTTILTPSVDQLRQRTQYTSTIVMYGQERISGSWRAATRLDGSSIDQTVSTTWTTGTTPDTIVPTTVFYSYPRNMQRYFLPRERVECGGTIYLFSGRSELFGVTSDLKNNYTYHTRFVSLPGNVKTESNCIYNSYGRQGAVQFNIPSLQPNTIYALQVIRRASPKSTGAKFGVAAKFLAPGGGYKSLSTAFSRGDSNTVVIESRKLNGIELGRVVAANEKLIYIYFFKTSRYATLPEKLASLTDVQSGYSGPLGMLELPIARYNGPEGFDKWDAESRTISYGSPTPTNYTVPRLIVANAPDRDAQWHRFFTEPWIYTPAQNMVSWGVSPSSFLNNLQFNRFGRAWQLAEIKNPEEDLSEGEVRAVTGSTMFDRLLMSGMFRNIGLSYRPVVPGSSSPFSSSTVSTLPPAKVTINYVHGVPIPLDFNTVRNEAARVLSIYGGDTYEFLTREEQAYLNAVRNKSYEMIWRRSQAVYPSTPPSLIPPVRSSGGSGKGSGVLGGGVLGFGSFTAPTPTICDGIYNLRFHYEYCNDPDLGAPRLPKPFTFTR